MKLTRKKSIELCISLWTWLAKTGDDKSDWPEWEKYGLDDIDHLCWFCEYDKQRREENEKKTDTCCCCPLGYGFNGCCEETYYKEWDNAGSPEDRKKYAKLFLAQIKTLRSK